MDDRLQTFEEHRSLLFSIAYRMLGSVMEAEDVTGELPTLYGDGVATRFNSPKLFSAPL
ncbi:MAG: hypothetical protein R2932_31295 [Caldilineaceae bacterium]